ncbi:MAG: response regulator [Planctomycetota bacterium]
MSEAPGRLEDVRVLIVDDDKEVLESIDAAFQSEGAMTALAMDGNEAVRVCNEDPPDVVVLDMMLPKRSGFLVVEKIKGKNDSPIVIMLTANEGKRHQAYAESLGVDKYMLKPVPLERLLAAAIELVKVRGPVVRAPRDPLAAGADDEFDDDFDDGPETDDDDEE